MLLELLPFFIPVLILLPIWLHAINKYGAVSGLIVGFVISLWLASVFVYFGHALIQNSSNRFGLIDVFSPRYFREILPGFLACFIVFVVATFLIDVLLQWYKTGVLNQTRLVIWLAISILVPGSYYGYKRAKAYLEDRYKRLHFLKVDFKISHYEDMPIIVDRLGFRSPTTSKSDDDDVYIYTMVSKQNSRDDIEETDVLDRDTLVRMEDKKIPIDTDKLLLSWYSIMEDKYYRDTFDFPRDKLTIRDIDGHSFIFGDMDIIIYPGGRMCLYNKNFPDGKKIIQQYCVASAKEIMNEKKQMLLDKFLAYPGNDIEQDELLQVAQEYQKSDLLEQLYQMQERAFSWKIKHEFPDKIQRIRVEDFSGKEYQLVYKAVEGVSKSCLPRVIRIKYKSTESSGGYDVMIEFNSSKLYEQILQQTRNDDDVPLEFLITDPGDGNIEVYLQTPEQKAIIKDTRIT